MNYAALENLYTVIREIFKDSDVYYSAEEVEKLKQDANNVFLERGKDANKTRYKGMVKA